MKIDELKGSKDARREAIHYQKLSEQLKREIAKLERELGEQAAVARAVRDAIEAAEPFERVPYKRPTGKGHSPVAVVFNYSDWHTGSKVKPRQIEGVNEYSWKTEQRRIEYIQNKEIDWVSTQRNSYTIDEAWLFILEDMISGDIHQELMATNEFPPPVQAVSAGLLLGECILRMAAHFGAVHVIPVGVDNHSRLSKKYQFKDAYQNSWCYVVHHTAKLYSKNAGNVDYQEAEGIKRLVKVSNHNFLLEHGHLIKGWAGFPYYGMGRSKGREAQWRMKALLEEWRTHKTENKREFGFDYYNLAHFHVPNWLEGDTFVNGALQGTDQLDHACGRFAKPAQIAYLVHPRHGVFNYVPFRTD